MSKDNTASATADNVHSETAYTKEELDEFRGLVEKAESINQIARIESRLRMPEFIDRVGREKCDAMFEVLKRELSATQQ